MKSKGMVLMITLMMITLVMTLTLSLMQGQVQYVQYSGARIQNHQQFYELEAISNYLLEAVLHNKIVQCKKALHDINIWQHDGWNTERCRFVLKDQVYEYFLDDLGEQDCLLIKTPQGLRSVHHWRLTVLLRRDKNYDGLQYRISSASMHNNCRMPYHTGTTGRLSWRSFKG